MVLDSGCRAVFVAVVSNIEAVVESGARDYRDAFKAVGSEEKLTIKRMWGKWLVVTPAYLLKLRSLTPSPPVSLQDPSRAACLDYAA